MRRFPFDAFSDLRAERVRDILLLFFLILVICAAGPVSARSGMCGTNVAYTISGDTVTFSKYSASSDAVWDDSCRSVIKENDSVQKVKASDTIRVLSGKEMFIHCSGLTEIDLANFDFSAMTSAQYMFADCTGLTALDISGLDTSNLTNMAGMFQDCRSLTKLDVSDWDTSNVTGMWEMFTNCSSLTKLDVSRWDTSKVDNMWAMFDGCTGLTALDFSGWDTSGVTMMDNMLFELPSLRHLTLGPDFRFVGSEENIISETPLTWIYAQKDPSVRNDEVPLRSIRSISELVSSYDGSTMAGAGRCPRRWPVPRPGTMTRIRMADGRSPSPSTFWPTGSG